MRDLEFEALARRQMDPRALLAAVPARLDDRYGHLARDSEDTIRARLDARAGRSGDSGVPRGVTDRTLARENLPLAASL
jgi:hypothetical protein